MIKDGKPYVERQIGNSHLVDAGQWSQGSSRYEVSAVTEERSQNEVSRSTRTCSYHPFEDQAPDFPLSLRNFTTPLHLRNNPDGVHVGNEGQNPAPAKATRPAYSKVQII
jgi:hypothetical protein